MKRMEDFIKEIRERHGLKTQAELAAKLGLTQATVSAHYNRTKRAKHYSDRIAYRIAELLDEDPLYVLSCLNHERSDDPKLKQQWKRVEQLLRGVTAALLLSVFASIFMPQPAQAGTVSISHNTNVLYIMRRLRMWWHRLCLQAFPG